MDLEQVRAGLREQRTRFEAMGKAGLVSFIAILLLDRKDGIATDSEWAETGAHHLQLLQGMPKNLPKEISFDDYSEEMGGHALYGQIFELYNWAKNPPKLTLEQIRDLLRKHRLRFEKAGTAEIIATIDATLAQSDTAQDARAQSLELLQRLTFTPDEGPLTDPIKPTDTQTAA